MDKPTHLSLFTGIGGLDLASEWAGFETKEDDRFLWPEMLRIISEIKPAWVIGENVAGIISMALDDILADLENIGYSAQSFNIPACAIGAPHRRKRVFIVANSTKTNGNNGNAQKRRDNSEETPLEYRGRTWWDSEPKLCRVVDGVPSKLDIDRNECLGNAVVPQQAYPMFKAIFEEVMLLRQNAECSQRQL